MAEEKKIVIEIVTRSVQASDSGTKEMPTTESIPGSNKETQAKSNGKISTSNLMTSVKSLAKKAQVLNLASAATSSIFSSIRRYASLTENYIAQEDNKNLQTGWSKIKSLAANVAVGYATGGELGAVMSVAAWGIRERTNYQERMSGYYQQLNATTYQTNMDRARLGLTNEGKGTEN